MMTSFKSISLVILLIISFIYGCSSKTVNFIEWTDPLGKNPDNKKRMVLTDEKLTKQVGIESLTTDATETGLLKAQVRLKNYTNKMISLEYRFDWLESNSNVFQTPVSRWTIKHIYGGDAVAITGVAPHNKISQFVLKLKRR